MVERSLGGSRSAVSRRRRVVFAVWVALLAAGGWFSLHQSDHLSGGGWEVPGARRSASPTRSSATFRACTRRSSPSSSRAGHPRVTRAAADTPLASRRARSSGRARAPRRRPGSALATRYRGASSNAIDEATRLRHALVRTTPTVQTRVIGEPAIWSNFQDVSKKQLARGEAIGFPLILLILLAGFGTLVAAVAPLALGFAAVFLTGAAIYALSRSFEISVYVTNMASMIGIGVAVDYSLFIVSRFRRELHAGADKDASARAGDVELRHRRRLQRRDRRRVARCALRDRRERAALDGRRRDRRRLHLRARVDHASARAARGRRHARRPAAPAPAVADDARRAATPSGAAGRGASCAVRSQDSPPEPGLMLVLADSVLLDADVQPRARRAAERTPRCASQPSTRKR